ncbi:MAG: polysaccharide deacetylase, partial [Sphingorhabdus sp.]|nr:polysaccharide deacetylase [Sphingorhabdus sp.]
GPFEEVLEHIAGDGRAWITKAGDIVDAFRAQMGDAK